MRPWIIAIVTALSLSGAAAANETNDSKASEIRSLLVAAESKRLSGDMEAAVLLCEQAISINSESADAWLELGISLQLDDRFSRARECYELAAKYENVQPRVWYFLGGLDEHFDDGPGAVVHYRKYLRTAGETAMYALPAKERISRLSRYPHETQKMFTKAQLKEAREANAIYDSAVKLIQAGRQKESEELFAKIGIKAPHPADEQGKLLKPNKQP